MFNFINKATENVIMILRFNASGNCLGIDRDGIINFIQFCENTRKIQLISTKKVGELSSLHIQFSKNEPL